MSGENLLWGAPRIHGELLKLGFAVAQPTVAKYMAGKIYPSGQSWGTFLRNHMPHIAAMDLFVVPTIGFGPIRRPIAGGLQLFGQCPQSGPTPATRMHAASPPAARAPQAATRRHRLAV